MPRVSIIVPAYNAEAYLKKCIESVLVQSFSDWELIIVDDGSIDATSSLCDEYALKDSRIRVIHQGNAGVSTARNIGMASSSGELIAFLDADDWLEPGAYMTLTRLLDESGADTAACGNYLVYDDGSLIYENPPMSEGVYLPEEAKGGIAIPLLCDRLVSNPLNGYVWRYLFDRSVITENNITFTGAYLEDELFLIEYFCADTTLATTRAPLYFYYQNPRSVTKSYMRDFRNTFENSLAIKVALIDKYDIPVTSTWRDNTCWSGLLIAVGNEFAPGNKASLSLKIKSLRALCSHPDFSHALNCYHPRGMPRTKAAVALLLRIRAFWLLSLLYSIKNRNRG